MQFSPKILGLNVGIFGTVSNSLELNFVLCVLFLCVIAGKMNNMLFMRKIMLIYAYLMC